MINRHPQPLGMSWRSNEVNRFLQLRETIIRAAKLYYGLADESSRCGDNSVVEDQLGHRGAGPVGVADPGWKVSRRIEVAGRDPPGGSVRGFETSRSRGARR